MGLNYVVTKRIFGFDKTKTEKFVVAPVTSGEVSFEKLCTQTSQICGAHRGNIQLVISGLIDAMINNLDDGKSVRLGDFGIFRPAIKTRAANSADEASGSNIYRRRINFTPGKAFKNAMKDMSITRFSVPDTDYTVKGSDSGDNSGGNDFIDPTA